MDKIIGLVQQEIEKDEHIKEQNTFYKEIIDQMNEIKENPKLLSSFTTDSLPEDIKETLNDSSLAQLEVYKVFLQSNVFELTIEQKQHMETILESITKKLQDTIEFHKDINKEINSLQLTKKRISEGNFDTIKEKDFFRIEGLLEKLSSKEQLAILKQLIVLNGKKKNKMSVSLSNGDELEEFRETNIEYEQVSKIFKKYNLNIEEDEHIKNNLLKYGILENIDQILDFLNKKELLTKIDYKEKRKKQFIDILAYSNIDIVKKMYDFSEKRKIKFDFLLNAPSNFIPSNKKLKQRTYRKRKGTSNTSQSKQQGARGTAEFFDENVKLLEGFGFNINHIIENNYSTLSNIHLKSMIESLILYGFKIDNTFALSAMSNGKRVDYIIDKYIELDLYPYIIENASCLNNYTYKFLENIYYTKQAHLPVLSRGGRLVRKVIDMIEKPDLEYRIIDLDQKYEKEGMPVDELYTLASFADYKDINSILEDEYIQKLEKENKVNDLIYKIDDITISRLKVLRIYSSIVKDEKIDKQQGLLFAVTNNSLLNGYEYNGIKTVLKERVK